MNVIRNISLALIVGFVATASPTLACGGGGSGSYRKPARPGTQHHSPTAPTSQQGSTAPQNTPQ